MPDSCAARADGTSGSEYPQAATMLVSGRPVWRAAEEPWRVSVRLHRLLPVGSGTVRPRGL